MRSALLAQPPRTAWLVATGSLTNPALLFAAFPELIPHIAGLSVMGGAIGGGFTGAKMGIVVKDGSGGERWQERTGNWSQWAEFNIYVSRHAILADLECEGREGQRRGRAGGGR